MEMKSEHTEGLYHSTLEAIHVIDHPQRTDRYGSAERADDFAVSGLRERLQRLRAHEAEAPELKDVTGHDGVVRRLADCGKSNSPMTG